MEHALSYSIFLSPMVLIITTVLGAGLALRWRAFGRICACLSLILFYLLATPLIANLMIWELESRIVDNYSISPEPAAIVVLGGDVEHPSPTTVRLGLLSLQRVFFATEQYHTSALPILVTGGRVSGTDRAVADLMAEAFKDIFAVPVRWRETKANTTYENAEFSAEILKKEGISTVILVTQRWHMPRAIWAFARFGIRAVPTRFVASTRSESRGVFDLIASASALEKSSYAIHEILGIAYYKLTK